MSVSTTSFAALVLLSASPGATFGLQAVPSAARSIAVRDCRSHRRVLARSVVRACAAGVDSASAGTYSERFGSRPPTLSLAAPAKVNLFLRILGKREDGFHELASLFQTVSLRDTLDFWEEPPDASAPIASMEVDPESVGREGIPTDDSNLVMRALQLYAAKTGEARRIHCKLRKAIPAQAGLGGGSGDAATALFAANQLAGFPVAESTLIEWAGELGSDISFFFSQGSAYCTGRGEVIEDVPPLPPTAIYLVKPRDGLSTPLVFKALGLQPGEELPGAEPRGLLSQFQTSVYGAPFVNDLEPPAFEVMPQLGQLRDSLAAYGFQAVMMSGSGSTIFCIGLPTRGVDTWRDEVQSKYDVDIWEEAFCRRPDDRTEWYGEA